MAIASAIALIGIHRIRPVQPRWRSRATNAARVITSGSKRFTIGGDASKCVAHHAIAAAHRPTWFAAWSILRPRRYDERIATKVLAACR